MLPATRLLLFSALLGLAPDLLAQDGHRTDELGLTFDRPGASWTKLDPEFRPGGGQEYRYIDEEDEDRSISLIVWQLEQVPTLPGLCDSEQDQMGARGKVTPIDRGQRSVVGCEALSTRYRLDRTEEKSSVVIDATYFQGEAFLGRLAVTLPWAELDQLDEIVTMAITALRLETSPPRPFDFGEPDPQSASSPGEEAPGALTEVRFEGVYRVYSLLIN